MRAHWKKILLLIVLAVLANRGMAANVAVWPDAGGGTGTQLADEYATFVLSAAGDTAVTLSGGAWTTIDGAGDEWTLLGSSSACFSESADAVLKYTCAETRVCTFAASGMVWGDTMPAGQVADIRISRSNNGGSSYVTFGGTGAETFVQMAVDVEYAPFPTSIVTADISQDWLFRVSAKNAGTAGSVQFRGVRLSVFCPGGVSGVDGADANFAVDGATNENVLAGRALVSTEASSTTLTTLDMSGSVITNTGAAASVTYTLGTATCSAGMQFTVLNAEDGQPIVLDPYSTVDQIINLTDAAGDSVTSDGVSTSAISCQCIAAGDWFCTRSGSWTDTN